MILYTFKSKITNARALVFGLGTVVLGSDMKGLTERLVSVTLGQYFFVLALKVYRDHSHT